jgi:hypothetical protein
MDQSSIPQTFGSKKNKTTKVIDNMQLRKLAASALGALMTGATLAFPALGASLADYPSPFVQDGEANFSVVVGSNAAASDVAGAVDVAVTLGGQPTVEKTAQTEGEASYSISEGVALERVGEKIVGGAPKGDELNNAKNTIRGDDLALLEQKTFQNEDGDELDSRTKVRLLSNAPLKFGKTADDLDEPITYFDTQTGPLYELVWNPDSFMPNNTANEEVKLFGKTLTFAGSDSDLQPDEFVMYGSAVTETINTGDSKEIMGSTVEVVGANDAKATATIEVNGERKTVEAGNQYTVGGEKVYIEDVFITTIPEKTASVSISLGSEEWTFKNGSALSMGDDDVDGTNVLIDYSDGKVNSVNINVTPSNLDKDTNAQGYDEYNYLEMGGEFVDPVFGTTKISFAGMNVPADSENREEIRIEGDGNDIKMTFTNLAGNEYSMDMINKSMEIREDLYVSGTPTVEEDEYVLVKAGSAPHFTHILEVKNVDVDDEVCEVVDVATGEDVGIFEPTNTCVLELEEEITATASDGEITVSSGVTSNIYTKNHMNISLGMINGTDTETILVSEDYNEDLRDELSGAIVSDAEINVTHDGDEALVKGGIDDKLGIVSVEDEDDVGGTPFGTMVTYDDEDDAYITLSVPNKEVNYKAFFGSEAATVSSSAGGEVTYDEIQPITSSVARLDTEIEAPADVTEDLILVGGPSVNMHVKTLVQEGKLEGTDENATETWNMWSEDTPEIQLVEDAFAEGQTALVVAGYSAEDTRAASEALQDIAGLPDAMTKNV